VYGLRQPLEDGMRIVVLATPKLTDWGKFSLTIKSYKLVGEGTLQRGFELLKQKLDKEGLFRGDRKRSLPQYPQNIAVISSKDAAGFKDFIKILDDRWGGANVEVAHTQVQGDVAADQIMRALNFFNQQHQLPDVIVIIRGGGSADDLSVFNDERLVRAVASSRVPVLTGIGHEVDTTLCDLAADVRASTPTNAAQLIVPTRHELKQKIESMLEQVGVAARYHIEHTERMIDESLESSVQKIDRYVELVNAELSKSLGVLSAVNPNRVLARGYAIVRGEVKIGSLISVEKSNVIIDAEVKNVTKR